jgi:hypothetical protein
LALTINQAGNNYYTPPAGLAVAPTVYDGQDAGRAIPVTQANIAQINTYANTTNGLARHYKLAESVTLDAPASGQSNWTPIGLTNTATFTGSFDGNYKTITGLTINGSTFNYAGMFGYASGGAVIKNLGLVSVSISNNTGSSAVGVAGAIAGSTVVEKCFVTGSFLGNSGYTGGVVGQMLSGGTVVQNCYSAASVSGGAVGGLVGYLNAGTIQYCYVTGSVSGGGYTGGVIGRSWTGTTITKCVVLTSSIYRSNGSPFRVGGDSSNPPTCSYNYGIGTSGASSHANIYGENTSTVSGNVKNPATQAFWTTDSNWGGANTAWNLTDIWQWSNLGRPILQSFAPGTQGES